MDNNKKNTIFYKTSKKWGLPIFVGLAVSIIIIAGLKKVNDYPSLSLALSGIPSNNADPLSLKQQCFKVKANLSEADMKVARIAWKYFENNYQEKTGLFNAANNYPSTTMWDTGSYAPV